MMEALLATEVSRGSFFADDFFYSAFGETVPEWGHHLVLFYRVKPGFFLPLCYVNFLEHSNVMLVGGAVTNRTGFVDVDPAHAAQLRAEGGAYYQLLKYGFGLFADRCDAFFGHAGDQRAYEVDLKAGFIPTEHEHLIVNFHKPMNIFKKKLLIKKIHAIGPF
jgi:hypothetical protein